MSPPRVALLAEGLFSRTTAKTAIGALRYAPFFSERPGLGAYPR